MKIPLNYRYAILVIALAFLAVSCKKDDVKTTDVEKLQTDVTLTETNEDLLTVDYDYFYKELAPHGEWIEVSAKDLGIDIKPGKTSSSTNTLFGDILGVKTAYAQTGEEIFNLFVWRPANELVANMVNESQEKQYTPYNNGQWIYTDEGWYFKANTPQEDMTCHYGRWAWDPALGWVWLPGKVYSPAWVDMRENDNYVAWAPVPPGVYIQNDAITQTTINENRYTIVEKKQFIEPSVYKYRYQYVENKNKIMIKEFTKCDGVMIKNKTVINKGPDVGSIEKSTGKKIEQVKIKKVSKKEEAVSDGNSVGVYTPEFKKSKEVKKEPVSKPDKRVSYKDAKKITKDEKEELKQEEKEMKKEDKDEKKEQKKEEKELKKEEKKQDKDVKKEDKGQGKDKDKDMDKDKTNKKSEKEDKVKDKNDKGKDMNDKGKK